MFYYIKKFWKMSGIIIFMLFIDARLSSYRSLALMESLEELVRGNFRGFLFWTLLNLLCVVLVQVFVAVEDILGKHVIRKMSNQVRRDMAATMLQMSHGRPEYLHGHKSRTIYCVCSRWPGCGNWDIVYPE